MKYLLRINGVVVLQRLQKCYNEQLDATTTVRIKAIDVQ